MWKYIWTCLHFTEKIRAVRADGREDKDMQGEHSLKRISREVAYRGSILDFCTDTVRLPDGKLEKWDFVRHRKGRGACVVPVLPDGRILMEEQFRPAVDRMTLELPAGGADGEENTAETAARELREETGYSAGRLRLLCSIDTAVAYCNERTDIYLAEDLVCEGGQQPDEAEDIRVTACRQEDLRRMIAAGQIRDAKTIAGLLAYWEGF